MKELDGPFQHTVQVEKGTTKVVLNCHSRARRNKKKKVPLLTSEEVDIDHAVNDPDSPILWIRLDPDCHLIRKRDFILSQTIFSTLLLSSSKSNVAKSTVDLVI